MKLRLLIFGYACVLAIHLLSIREAWDTLQHLSKLMLMPLLMTFVGFQKPSAHKELRLLLAALAFSWMGDLLLQVADKEAHYFILGLVAFLLAHLCYIGLFGIIKKREQHRKWHPLIILLTFLCTASLIIYLLPNLGALTLPVIAYALILGAMLVMAAHALPITNPVGKLWILGAGSFVCSDSLLAINKFHIPFSGASLLIMLSYGLAQGCLSYGIVHYSVSRNKQ